MECSNCGETFKVYKKSYGRKPLISLDHGESILHDIIGSDITPKSKRDERFVCPNCEKLLKSASIGESSKQKLFEKTSSGSYISVKRKREENYFVKKKLKYTTSTPVKRQDQKASTSTGARYMINYHYKAGFRWFMKRSNAAKRELLSLLVKSVRREVSCLFQQDLPITKKATFEAFRNLRWDDLIKLVKAHAPVLYNVIVGACTYPGNEETLMRGKVVKGVRSKISLKPVIGSVICQILGQIKPLKANLFQKMNAIQMWRAGCKRSLLSDFHHIGISVAENALLSTLDKLAATFDKGLRQWKRELEISKLNDISSTQDHVYQRNTQQQSEDVASLSDDEVDTSQLSPIFSSESSESMDEWEDVEPEESLVEDPTIPYVEDEKEILHGYTICWDNVG